MSEKTKILEMLANGQITVEEASDLLNAISSDSTGSTGSSKLVTTASSSQQIKKKARMIRINVFKENSVDVNVNVPIALAKFATRFIPDEAKIELNNQDIDLKEMLELLKQDDLAEGKLLEVDTIDDGLKVRVLIEVV